MGRGTAYGVVDAINIEDPEILKEIESRIQSRSLAIETALGFAEGV